MPTNPARTSHASDPGIAADLGVNAARELGNIGIGCPECVQAVTLDSPTPQENPLGQAAVHFQGHSGPETAIDINGEVIGFIYMAPTANLAKPVALSQFPPR